MSIACVLWLLAMVLAVISGSTSKVPLWFAVFVAAFAGLIGCLPIR